MGKYYAVAVGRVPKVYESWDEAKKQVYMFPGAKYKSFYSREEADEFMRKYIQTDLQPTYPLKDKFVVYTDGSYTKGRGGYGLIIINSDGSVKMVCGELLPSEFKKITNNVGELFAIYVALHMTDDDINIFSDSQYSINSVKGLTQPKENVELIDSIKQLLYEKKLEGIEVNIDHVYAHKNDEMNNLVDQLAKYGRDSGLSYIEKDSSLAELGF